MKVVWSEFSQIALKDIFDVRQNPVKMNKLR